MSRMCIDRGAVHWQASRVNARRGARSEYAHCVLSLRLYRAEAHGRLAGSRGVGRRHRAAPGLGDRGPRRRAGLSRSTWQPRARPGLWPPQRTPRRQPGLAQFPLDPVMALLDMVEFDGLTLEQAHARMRDGRTADQAAPWPSPLGRARRGPIPVSRGRPRRGTRLGGRACLTAVGDAGGAIRRHRRRNLRAVRLGPAVRKR